jgi:hypothetical protein
MTNVGAAELVRRLDSLLRGTARNPPTAAETALLALIRGPVMRRHCKRSLLFVSSRTFACTVQKY